MTSKEIFHHPSKRVINEQTGNSENLDINVKNSFQYLSDMGDDLEHFFGKIIRSSCK